MTKRGTSHTRSRYDFIAPLYNVMEWPVEQLFYHKWREQLWKQVEGPEVLEIGVGTGKNIPWYADDVHVTGIDLSPKMLKRADTAAKKNASSIVTLLEMDAQNLAFSKDTFNTTVATFAFCSIPDPVEGLREALRVTKPGGSLLLLEHMRSKNAFAASVMKLLDGPIHYLIGVHIARETVKNVEAAGWNIKEVKDLTSTGIFRFIHGVKPEGH